MHCFFFGETHRQLYGVYHAPTAAVSKSLAIVLCPALAQEQTHTQWTLRRLASNFAECGFHCLRFDYYGSGDSAGNSEEGSTEQWVEDILLAVQEIKDIAACEKVSLIGLRYGAILAALACQKTAIEQLLFWDPVVDGKQYIQDLKTLTIEQNQQFELAAYNLQTENNAYIELSGFAYVKEKLDSICHSSLKNALTEDSPPYAAIISDSFIDKDELKNVLADKYGNSDIKEIKDTHDWYMNLTQHNPLLIPAAMINAITEKMIHFPQ